MEVNKDPPNENQPKVLIQSWLQQESQPPSLAQVETLRQAGVGRLSRISRRGLRMCPDGRNWASHASHVLEGSISCSVCLILIWK